MGLSVRSAPKPGISEIDEAPRSNRGPRSLVDWTNGPGWLAIAAVSVAVLVAVALRFLTVSNLWLDEALTVNISKLPLTEIPGALKRDGAPPLYYFALHLWMRLFGDSDLAVRSLSGVSSVATLPMIWLVARRLATPRAAWAALLILASSPFALRYATETRMYALVAFEVTLAFLVYLRARAVPTIPRLAAVGLVAVALLYTHYWSLYLLLIVVSVLAWRARTRGWRTATDGRVALAIVVAGVLWLPWVPTFLYQAQNTGTPWTEPASPAALISLFTEFSGGAADGPRTLMVLLLGLCILGLFGRALDRHRIEVDLRTRPVARPIAVVLVGCPAIALAAGVATQTAFVSRYTSVVLPFFVLLAALGAATVIDRRRFAVVLTVVVMIGFGISIHTATRNRSQAGDLAAQISASAKSGDLVVYCPDQLGPSTSRLLGNRFDQVSFPRGDGPRFVNWVDYSEVNENQSPAAFAAAIAERAGPDKEIWLVSSNRYLTSRLSCPELEVRLLALRPGGHQVQPARTGRYFEAAALIRYPPSTAEPR